MQYSDFVTALSELTVISSSNSDFLAILPRAIDYAEQRIYRELDLLVTNNRNSSYALTAGNRNLVLTGGTFVVLKSVSIITPYGTVNPELGTRVLLAPVSWDFLNLCYGNSSVPGVPQYWAAQDMNTLAFAPWPNAAYQVELTGTIRPTPLSALNTTTYLSLYLPDLFLTAAMIFMASYMQNYGAQSDNTGTAQSFEAQYKSLLLSAAGEEARKRGDGAPIAPENAST